MLTKEKRTKLIGGLLTLTMATTMVAGCSSEEDEATAEWSNENAAVEQQSSHSSFWDMVTAFGLGYALSSLFRGNSAPPPVPPKQPPAYTSTTKPGDTQTKASQPTDSSVSKSTATTSSKVASPSTGKTGIGSSSFRSSAVS